MENVKIGRRERRRKIAESKTEGNESVLENEKMKKTIENEEYSTKPQSFGELVRRDTYTVLNSKRDFEKEVEEESCSGSSDSKNFTYNLGYSLQLSNCGTYSVDESPDKNEPRPIPAPRKQKIKRSEQERISSDTDRDITEIDLDDFRQKSPLSDTNSKHFTNSSASVKSGIVSDIPKSELIMAPIPKPRTSVRSFYKSSSNVSTPKDEHLQSSNESLNIKYEDLNEKSKVSDVKENFEINQRSEEPLEPNQLPLQSENNSVETKKISKKQKKLIGEIFDLKRRKNKPSKSVSSLMKLEKKKIPKISSILKDLKEEEEKKDFKIEIEDKIDFQIDSPHFTESAENGRIYVQNKNGFRVMERDEILRNGNKKTEKDGNGGMLEDSTVKTAILFQKYWSRSMIYFHGVLGGFGFSHAATVTAIMLHYNYEPQGFIGIYSCLSLKIHYVFYALTVLCIISCFDRVDIGHMNRRHWESAWKVPSMWVILCIYLASFVLTFSNQITEARFDAHSTSNENETELWNAESESDIQVGLLQWYHTIWARDMLVLLAWLMISLTKFSDFLHSHIVNMAKYSESKDAERSIHHMAGPKGDY